MILRWIGATSRFEQRQCKQNTGCGFHEGTTAVQILHGSKQSPTRIALQLRFDWCRPRQQLNMRRIFLQEVIRENLDIGRPKRVQLTFLALRPCRRRIVIWPSGLLVCPNIIDQKPNAKQWPSHSFSERGLHSLVVAVTA